MRQDLMQQIHLLVKLLLCAVIVLLAAQLTSVLTDSLSLSGMTGPSVYGVTVLFLK